MFSTVKPGWLGFHQGKVLGVPTKHLGFKEAGAVSVLDFFGEASAGVRF